MIKNSKSSDENKSIRGVLIDLSLVPADGNYAQVNKRISELGLSTSHFTGQGWSAGLRLGARTLDHLHELLVENSDYQSFKLKRLLFREELKNQNARFVAGKSGQLMVEFL
ncbi:hypothetical protein IPM09_00955 [Candidatus Saccharibacteria bacterium]|nr:MAG: hypothetical protein IPM09_00955 [Candidatus Saccharibacteria bacterium]